MFDGPGGLEQVDATLENFLATEVEAPAADALLSFCRGDVGSRRDLPPPMMRYLAWAAARSLTMAKLEQLWAHDLDPKDKQVVEPPPAGIEKIRDRERPLSFQHPTFGIRDDVSSAEVESLIEAGWKWNLNRDDLLESMHMQAWYFQVRHFPRMNWVVLDAPDGKSFVIGDRPVVWGFQGDVAVPPNMLRHPDVQLFAPLSRSVALLAHNTRLAPPFGITPELVNSVMASGASKWIAGSDERTVESALAAGTASVA
jgi:hypothetical protein